MTQHEQDTYEGVLRPAAKLTKLSVNLTAADLVAVDAVVEQHEPFVRRHAVHLAALRLGLQELHAKPERLIEQLHREQQRRSKRG
jgi:hypothetical protein